MMTSRIITSIERKYYIKRSGETGDARSNLIIITQKGEDILLQSSKAVTEMEKDFFKPVTKSGSGFIKFMQDLFPEAK